MVIGPVFGVLVVEGLTHHAGLIDPNDKVLRFVCIYFAGVPTGTTQVRNLTTLVDTYFTNTYSTGILDSNIFTRRFGESYFRVFDPSVRIK